MQIETDDHRPRVLPMSPSTFDVWTVPPERVVLGAELPKPAGVSGSVPDRDLAPVETQPTGV